MVDKSKPAQESSEIEKSANPIAKAIEKIAGDLNRSPEEMSRAMTTRILEAETIDEIFEEQSTLGAEDVLGIPHLIESVDFSKSRFEDGNPAFAIVHGKNDAGESFLYTNGSTTCLAQLVRAYEALPLRLILKQKSTATAQGYYPMFYTKPSAS